MLGFYVKGTLFRIKAVKLALIDMLVHHHNCLVQRIKVALIYFSIEPNVYLSQKFSLLSVFYLLQFRRSDI